MMGKVGESLPHAFASCPALQAVFTLRARPAYGIITNCDPPHTRIGLPSWAGCGDVKRGFPAILGKGETVRAGYR